ncbi:MAG: recombinase family protein [Clostridia bacterium]|nr:recombinase family protein [Clostridia bacterium]
MIKWKVGVYLRLSSDDGDKMESNSITNQKNLINLFLKKEKDLKIYDYYIDDGFTGTDFNRPDFQRLLNDIKEGKINTVIVKDLSRFGRNYIEVGNYIEQVFPSYNVRFIAINDNVDSYKDPKSINNIIVPFKNLMNDEYARDISNKVRSVLNTKKANGEFIGSVAPYGYKKNPRDKHKLIIDKYASKIVKKIFKMILNGKSKTEVIDELNKFGILPPRLYQMQDTDYNFKVTEKTKYWDSKKLDKILKNQTYTGDLIQSKKRTISHKIHKVVENSFEDWIIIPNHHEAIISREDFNQVQDIIYDRDIKVNKNKEYDTFSGHLRCNDCGNSFTIKKIKKYEYYYCTSFLREKSCTNHSIKKEKLKEMVLNLINKQIELVIDIDMDIDRVISYNNINYDEEILETRLLDIDNNILKYEKLKEAIKDDLICKFITREEYTEYENEYNNCLKRLIREKKEISEKLKKINFKSDKNKEWINKFKENYKLQHLSKKVVDELIDDIYVYDNGNIKIVFKYEDEFFEAIDFLKKYNCDIIEKNCVNY